MGGTITFSTCLSSLLFYLIILRIQHYKSTYYLTSFVTTIYTLNTLRPHMQKFAKSYHTNINTVLIKDKPTSNFDYINVILI